MAVFQMTSCCHFRIFQKVAAKSVLNRWFIENYAPQTLFYGETLQYNQLLVEEQNRQKREVSYHYDYWCKWRKSRISDRQED